MPSLLRRPVQSTTAEQQQEPVSAKGRASPAHGGKLRSRGTPIALRTKSERYSKNITKRGLIASEREKVRGVGWQPVLAGFAGAHFARPPEPVRDWSAPAIAARHSYERWAPPPLPCLVMQKKKEADQGQRVSPYIVAFFGFVLVGSAVFQLISAVTGKGLGGD
jgi:hypothetical protein